MFNLVTIFQMLIIATVSYLLGCINASIIVTKLLDSGNDIRKFGSGNAGFTNVLRTKGKKLAVYTFLIDFLKGLTAIYISHLFMSTVCGIPCNSFMFCFGEYLSCLSCIIGHVYPCFFEFRGGKAILTAWATTLLIDKNIFVMLIIVFLIVLLITKIVSLASVVAAIALPISSLLSSFVFRENFSYDKGLISLVFCIVISVLVVYKHRANIQRIINGTEKTITIHK